LILLGFVFEFRGECKGGVFFFYIGKTKQEKKRSIRKTTKELNTRNKGPQWMGVGGFIFPRDTKSFSFGGTKKLHLR